MAGGILAGVNPIFGLYANIIGPVAGGLIASTQLMVIQNTSAVSLVAGQSLTGFSSAERESALFLMVVLSGVIATLFGRRLTRFVSYSVMTGFLTGIAIALILSQLPTLAGYEVVWEGLLLLFSLQVAVPTHVRPTPDISRGGQPALPFLRSASVSAPYSRVSSRQ
jgi:MFS superfamily sulfate permease-like transporter